MSDDHHEIVPNPDYEGPSQHCLPPEVKDSPGRGIVFVILMILLVLGAATMGAAILLA
jgi:hypothetical protein